MLNVLAATGRGEQEQFLRSLLMNVTLSAPKRKVNSPTQKARHETCSKVQSLIMNSDHSNFAEIIDACGQSEQTKDALGLSFMCFLNLEDKLKSF